MRKIIVVMLLLFAAKSEALPSRYDLRNYGRVTSVKNQGIPGPCWAFAALGAMESNYLTQKLNAGGKVPDFGGKFGLNSLKTTPRSAISAKNSCLLP